ncbi:MAG TPA: metallophosphoesterase [Methanobacteriaceae archaeon]|nr:metallophosphoesterase [Methanobacteriaceae archaeon]
MNNDRLRSYFLYGVIIFLVLLVLVLGPYFVPGTNNWNSQELGKFNHQQTNFTFLVFGDNRDSLGTFDELLQKMDNESALFGVDNGDLVSSGEKEQFSLFLEQLKRSKTPILTTLGNHDLKAGSPKNYQAVFGPTYYSFTVDDSYFIILDSGDGSMDSAQIEWLKGELEKSKSYHYRFVFMHYPLYDPRGNMTGTGHALENRELAHNLNQIFDDNNVTMIFTSHIHGFYQGTWGKTPFLLTGGAGAPLEYPDPNHNFYHYLKVSVSPENVDYQVVKV